jgi:hypothetical protein
MKGGRTHRLIAPRWRNALLCPHRGAPLPPFARRIRFSHVTLARVAPLKSRSKCEGGTAKKVGNSLSRVVAKLVDFARSEGGMADA